MQSDAGQSDDDEEEDVVDSGGSYIPPWNYGWADHSSEPPVDPEDPTTKAVNETICRYVDAWHEKNKHHINIGETMLPVIGKVDLFPPHMEKALFQKLWTSVVSNMLEMEFMVAGVHMRMTPRVRTRPPSRTGAAASHAPSHGPSRASSQSHAQSHAPASGASHAKKEVGKAATGHRSEPIPEDGPDPVPLPPLTPDEMVLVVDATASVSELLLESAAYAPPESRSWLARKREHDLLVNHGHGTRRATPPGAHTCPNAAPGSHPPSRRARPAR